MLSSGSLAGSPSSVIDLSEEEPEVIREGAGDVSPAEAGLFLFAFSVDLC